MVYHSFDYAVDDPHNYYHDEFLNTLTPNGLPSHVLKLKIGCLVILLKNIDPANGLYNGTKLIIWEFSKEYHRHKICVGTMCWKAVFLPRIPLCLSNDEMFSFQFKRKQFSIRLGFMMIIYKLKG